MVGVILTYMGYAPNSERVEGVLVPNAALKSPFAPMLIEGKVGENEVVEPGKDLYDYSSFYQFEQSVYWSLFPN